MKRELLKTIDAGLSVTGIAAAYARLADCEGAVILMYHTVADREDAPFVDPRNHLPPAVFRRQLSFLAEHRSVISLDDLIACLEAGETPPRGTVVITFDDGYRDNLAVAAPLLAEFELPATLYLATGYIDDAENQWIDEAYCCFAFRSRDTYQPPDWPRSWALKNPAFEKQAHYRLCSFLLTADRATRTAALQSAREQLQPVRDPPRLTLTWDEVRRLRRDYPLFTVGAHTHDHLDLSAVDLNCAVEDLKRCTETIHRETGERPRHFSYPYGRRAEAFDNHLQTCHYRSAVAAGSDTLLRPGADHVALARVEAPASEARFKYYTGGAYPRLSRLLTGRPR